MANHTSPSNNPMSADDYAKQEMLQSILSPQQPYPWQPSEAAADYFSEATAIGDELAFSDEEAQLGWQALSAQFDTFWGGSIQSALSQRFARRLSQDLIERITAKAAQVVRTGRPLAEQLIACVQDTLTGWDEADLQVMARPLAHAMRGQEEILEATINSVRDVEWDALSPMEQARISLAAARWAIDHVNR